MGSQLHVFFSNVCFYDTMEIGIAKNNFRKTRYKAATLMFLISANCYGNVGPAHNNKNLSLRQLMYDAFRFILHAGMSKANRY